MKNHEATVIDIASVLQKEKPVAFSSRSRSPRTLEAIRDNTTEILQLESEYLVQACRVLNHPALEVLASQDEITVALIKPRAYEGKNLPINREMPIPEQDNAAAEIVRSEIEKVQMREDGTREKGEILLDITLQFRPDQIELFYPDMKDRPVENWQKVWQGIVDHMSGGPVTFLLLQHVQKNENGQWEVQRDAVEWWRKRIGATKPEEAAPGTIRNQYARVVSNNIVHGSDSRESVLREARVIGNILSEYLPQPLKEKSKLH